MDTFTQSYIETALWSSLDDDNEPLDMNYGIENFSPETLATIEMDCKTFQEKYADLLSKAGDEKQNGHDFWLTRNGHGAGFWDREYPKEVSEPLTEVCKWNGEFGECHLYVGDDGFLYF